MRGHGVSGEPRIDWRELMAFRRSFTDPIPRKQEQRYASRDGYQNAIRGADRRTGTKRNTTA
jgi:glutathione reductase (NADPH)